MVKSNIEGRSVNGWNGGDTWAFEQLVIKANDEQLQAIIRRVKHEINNRFESEWAALDVLSEVNGW